MKALVLSAGLALGVGALALSPASAGPITQTTIYAPAASTDVACRTVEKRVRRNGVTRITRTQQCDRGRYYGRPGYVERRRYSNDRRYYRSNPRPSIGIRIN